MFPTNATNIAYILTSRFTSFWAFQSLIGFSVNNNCATDLVGSEARKTS